MSCFDRSTTHNARTPSESSDRLGAGGSPPPRHDGEPAADAGLVADVTTRLDRLDDLMFAAIDGDPVALQEVGGVWRKAIAELGPEKIEESRRQYLRQAQSVWNSLRLQPNHPPHKTFAAIEIISLLAGKAW